MPTDELLQYIDETGVRLTLKEVLSYRGYQGVMLAVLVMFELLVILASKRDKERDKAANYCLRSLNIKSYTAMSNARNAIAHNMYKRKEVDKHLLYLATNDFVCKLYLEFFSKSEVLDECRKFQEGILEHLSGSTYADRICELIPPSRRSDFPATNDEAALQFAYEQIIGA